MQGGEKTPAEYLKEYKEQLIEKLKTFDPKAKKRKHHFVPVFYLRNFINCRTKRLFVIQKATGKVYESKPESTGFERDYYLVGNRESGDYHVLIEELFAEIESDSAGILLKVLSGEEVSNSERAVFSLFAVTLFSRSRFSIEYSEQLIANKAEAFLRWSASDPDRFQRMLPGLMPPPKELGDSARDFFHSNEWRMEVNRNFSGPAAVDLAFNHALSFAQMGWTVAKTPIDMLCSDSPVAVVRTTVKGDGRYRAGVALQDARVAFPLNPRTVLILDWEHDEEGIASSEIDVKLAKEINNDSVVHAKDDIYCSAISEKIVRFIQNRRDLRIVPATESVPVHGNRISIITNRALMRGED